MHFRRPAVAQCRVAGMLTLRPSLLTVAWWQHTSSPRPSPVPPRASHGSVAHDRPVGTLLVGSTFHTDPMRWVRQLIEDPSTTGDRAAGQFWRRGFADIASDAEIAATFRADDLASAGVRLAWPARGAP